MRLSVVCYLDEESTLNVRRIQKNLSDLTGAKASFNLWLPHVTVGNGVEVDEVEFIDLQNRLDALAGTTPSFDVDLYDILKIDFRKGGEGEETTPYGLYLDVKTNQELLNLVSNVANISENLRKWYFMPSPYHPHCALAFKDLTKKGYEVGSKYLDSQNIKIKSKITSVSIVEMLPNKTKEYARFNFTQ